MCRHQILVLIQPLQAVQTGPIRSTWQLVARVAQKMHTAALSVGPGQHLADHLLQTFVTVRHHELHAMQSTRLQPPQELGPRQLAFLRRQFHRQHVCWATREVS